VTVVVGQWTATLRLEILDSREIMAKMRRIMEGPDNPDPPFYSPSRTIFLVLSHSLIRAAGVATAATVARAHRVERAERAGAGPPAAHFTPTDQMGDQAVMVGNLAA
jgi:hypothetical protein